MKEIITYDDFQKMDLRVATITEVNLIEGADKLYKLHIDLGEEKRQLLAGLRPYYKQEELIGKQLVVLINLEPKKMRGEVSEGMLLAADQGELVAVLSPDRKMPNGSLVR